MTRTRLRVSPLAGLGFLASLLAAAALPVPAAAEAKGDVDLDGDVDTADLMLLRAHLVDPVQTPLGEFQIRSANVSPLSGSPAAGEAVLNAADVLTLTRALAGAVTLPAVPSAPSLAFDTASGNPRQVGISGVSAGATVRLYVNGLLQSVETAAGASIILPASLDDGANTIIARASFGSGRFAPISSPSNSLNASFASSLAKQALESSFPGPGGHLVLTTQGNGTAYTFTPPVGTDIVFPDDATLSVMPGVIVEVPAGKRLVFGSSAGANSALIVSGSAAAPVTFRGELGAQWEGIDLASTADNRLVHVRIETARIGVRVRRGAELQLEDCSISGFTTGIAVIGPSNATILRCDLIDDKDQPSTTGISGKSSGGGAQISQLGVEESTIRAEHGLRLQDLVNLRSNHLIRNNVISVSPAPVTTPESIGLHLLGTSVTFEQNTVDGFDTAIKIEDVFPAVNSDPTIQLNSFLENTTNISVPNAPNASPVLLDATANWWGTSDPVAIRSKLDDSGLRVIDYSAYLIPNSELAALTGATSPKVQSHASVFSPPFVAFSRNEPAIYPQAAPAATNVSFETLAAGAAYVDVYRHDSVAMGLPVATLPTGECGACTDPLVPQCRACSASWTGQDDAGRLVPEDLYVLVPRVEATGEALEFIESNTLAGPGGGSPDLSFDPYRNDMWEAQFNATSGGLFMVEVHDNADANGTPRFTLTERLVLPPGTSTILYDGRTYSPGQAAPLADFLDTSDAVWIALQHEVMPKITHVTVHGTRPQISGKSRAAVQADPYLLYHSYDQLSDLEFCVDQPARVTVRLLQPDETDPTDPANYQHVFQDLATGTDLVDFEIPQATENCQSAPEVARWNDSTVPAPGTYTFTIEATAEFFFEAAYDPADRQAYTSLYRGVLQVR